MNKAKTSIPQKVKRYVGRYELGRTIGEGTFAKVRFARNSETGEPVAIKILDKEKILKHKLVEQVTFNFPTFLVLFLQELKTTFPINQLLKHNYTSLVFKLFPNEH